MKTSIKILATALTLGIAVTLPTWPAVAAPATPSWAGGSAPVPSISGTTLSATIPAITANSQHGTAFGRAWACTGPITAGFADWPYNNGATYLPPTEDFPVAGVDCHEFLSFDGSSTLDLASAQIDQGAGMSSPYSPFEHGAHIIVGRRLWDDAGTSGGVFADDVYWMAYSSSVELVLPTVSTQPTLALSGDVVTAGAAVWSGGTHTDYLVACTSPRATAVTTVTSAPVLQSGCRPVYVSNDPSNYAMAANLGAAYVSISGSRIPFDPSTHGSNIGVLSINLGGAVATATVVYGAIVPPGPASVAPYTGPVLQTPGPVAPVAQGSKLVIPGSNLSGVTKVEIGGVDAKVVVNSSGELEITVPTGLAAGTYDLVVTSDSGKLTVQDGIRLSEDTASATSSEARPSAKKNEEANNVKVRIFNVVGAGKVQIFVNGKEVAWVNAEDESDPKLFGGYLVRTITLEEGKNVIEVYVGGLRSKRWSYAG